ncbi:hypothetical protein, variant 1 [Aphanomyces astaci]|uniref:PH domain-containing protein n=1 Tax=Aphanomyces astaci TaxID=112090 RepID=W4H640_APHAT|nr:hypothetical protein, variant 1 [Aphanomyces astaci]ETV86563.1 hypothetical protein, variant 1 [Aphanomyces astaci]|eukprot:XP_009823364.1 hypothetical protein, variant 1 [Aphanomyces astaci]
MNSGYTEPSKARSSIASPSSSASSSSASNEPIKAGYLSKYNRGKWNAKRKWRQRWFVLENGVLMFFKSAPSAKSKKRAVPRDVFALGPSSKLMFPKDELPSITPSPFCFAVTASGSAKHILLCASSQQEFREWTALISATINPEAPPVVPPTPVYAMEQLQVYDNVMPPTSPMSPARSTLDSPTVAIGACLVLNPFMVLHFDLLVTAIVLLAALWCLSFLLTHRSVTSSQISSSVRYRMPPTLPIQTPSSLPEPVVEPTPDVCHVKTPTTVHTSASPVVGYVNGKKAFAGCSLTAVSPDEAHHATDSWTPLDATLFNVRRGPNYKKNKIKAPSGPAFLELVATDVFRSDLKVDNIGSKIQLPSDVDGRTDLMILNTQVPCYAPSNPLVPTTLFVSIVGCNVIIHCSGEITKRMAWGLTLSCTLPFPRPFALNWTQRTTRPTLNYGFVHSTEKCNVTTRRRHQIPTTRIY